MELKDFIHYVAFVTGMDWFRVRQLMVDGGLPEYLAEVLVAAYGWERARGEVILALEFGGLSMARFKSDVL